MSFVIWTLTFFIWHFAWSLQPLTSSLFPLQLQPSSTSAPQHWFSSTLALASYLSAYSLLLASYLPLYPTPYTLYPTPSNLCPQTSFSSNLNTGGEPPRRCTMWKTFPLLKFGYQKKFHNSNGYIYYKIRVENSYHIYHHFYPFCPNFTIFEQI